MKENRYDDRDFFEKYRRFPRSVEGLKAAGEWHALEKLLPDFSGKRVLDLGCGFGWHCRFAAERGAREVVGTDISQNMLWDARQRNSHPRISYRQAAMEDLEFPSGAFDVVLSSLALHYVEDYSGLIQKIWRWLVPGGTLVFSCEHPVFTAAGPQEWAKDREGTILHWPVDRYFEEGARVARFLECDVNKVHRTLTGYVMPLLRAGFRLTALVEPRPDPKRMAEPGMRDELRRPMMLLIAAVREPEDSGGGRELH